MTCHPADVAKPGELTIHYAPEGAKAVDFVVKYNPAQFEVSVEKIKLENMEDKGVKRNWGDNIQRINLKAKQLKTNEKYSLKISLK
jgi:hypothetical protein